MYNYLATTLIEHTKIDWTFEHHILAIVVYQVIYWRKYIIKITYEYNSIKLLNVYINARSWKDFNLKTKRLLPLETKDWSFTDEHHINLASLVANSEQWSCRNSSGSESVLKPRDLGVDEGRYTSHPPLHCHQSLQIRGCAVQ
jgi:hypothetical protein